MLPQDIATITILAASAASTVILHIMSRSRAFSLILEKRLRRQAKDLNWNEINPTLHYSNIVYQIYGVPKPEKYLKTTAKIQKHIKKHLKKALKRHNVKIPLEQLTKTHMRINNYDYNRIDNFTLTLEHAIFFINNKHDLTKIAQLQKRKLSYEQILEAYDIPLEWSESYYGVSEPAQPQPVNRF